MPVFRKGKFKCGEKIESIKKLFGEINITYLKLVIWAVIAGIYTGIMALLPVTDNTSFKDITATFDESYTAYLADDKFGEVSLEYDEGLEPGKPIVHAP